MTSHLPRRAILAVTGTLLAGCGGTPDAPTFNQEVAPIIFAKCAACHRPGEVAPFPLLTYRDVKRRARQIVEVTESRFMPPWLPEPGYGEFVGQERRLDEAEMRTLRDWHEAGAPEGAAADLPALPAFNDGWQLGEPDLILELPEPYSLPAEGVDVIRNFVLPSPVRQTRYVKSVEIRPGNKRVVHHAVLNTDPTPYSRRLDAMDPEPGFGGMRMGNAGPPDGHIVVWTPGSQPYSAPDGLAWRLQPGSDVVFQLHMLPSGRPESIRPRIGFTFADGAPERQSFALMLHDNRINIPPGEAAYEIRDTFELPIDVELLAIYPHAHYLGKSMEAWAELPDAARIELIRILDWDFNWQGMYRYRERLLLPAGTVLHMRFVYDNSEGNVRNPNNPPRPVVSGVRSSDEMGNLALQILPARDEDLTLLREAQWRKMLEENPEDPAAFYNLGVEYAGRGELVRAAQQFHRALGLDPDDEGTHYVMGSTLIKLNDFRRAADHFAEVVRINPGNVEACFVLGWLRNLQGRRVEAIEQFRRVLELDPGFYKAHHNLGLALLREGRTDEAALHFERSLQLRPDFEPSRNELDRLRASTDD